jgi:hypothetical protein
MDGLDQLPGSILEEIEEKEMEGQEYVERNQICKKYVFYEKMSSSYYIMVTIVILVYNMLFYMLVQPIVQLIGFHVRTNEIRLTSFTVFVCLIVDMIFLPLVLGANFIEHSDNNKIVEKIFKGKHTDFSHGWYSDVGF